jgi:acyl-CoA synthetase (AMP-forming)/AMP-acid ligase II
MNTDPQLMGSPVPLRLFDLLDEAARRWPEHTAVRDDGTAVTYPRLRDRSLALAADLVARGVCHGDRVVVVGPPTVEQVALLYAIGRAGAAFVLLHEQTVGEPLRRVLQDCTPALVVSADDAVQREADHCGVTAVDPAALTGDVASEVGLPTVLGVDMVCLIYTSGTTSTPKAVVSLHQQLCFVTAAIQAVLEYRADDVVYCPLPFSFDYGLYQLFLAAASGACVRAGAGVDAGPHLVRALVDAGATVLPAVPSVAEALARLIRRPGATKPALRLLTNTGAAMPAPTVRALRDALPGMRVQLMFGLTECKRATIMPPDGDLERPGSCGRALPGTEVFVVDAAGEQGEVVVRGPHVMSGYWRRPEQTAQRYPRREDLLPELRTGDYGWLDADGYLYFVGRRDDIYKEGGFRISTTEVEAAARAVPGVDSAAVLAPTEQRGAVLVAVTERTPPEVVTALREHLEEFKIPRRCVTLDALPLTTNGKVDRKRLAVLVEDGSHVR